MAKKKRVTRKELLKEPDKILTTSGKVFQYLIEHKTQATWIAGCFLMLFLIAMGINYSLNAAENRAFAMLDQGMQHYTQWVETKGSREAFLEIEAEFQEILDKYTGRRGGKLARMIFADICYSTGNLEKAINLYRSALKDFEGMPPYECLILKSLGCAYEDKKDYPSAAHYFEQIAADPSKLMRDDALFALGRIYTEMAQTQKGIDSYETLIEEYPDYTFIEIARDKVTG